MTIEPVPNPLPGNPHVISAASDLFDAEHAPLLEREAYATTAVAEATLAVAYEQRTATLLALFNTLGEKTYLSENLNGEKLAKSIRERLGL